MMGSTGIRSFRKNYALYFIDIPVTDLKRVSNWIIFEGAEHHST